MDAVEFVKVIAYTVGTLISIPIIVIIVRSSMFFGALCRDVATLTQEAIPGIHRRLDSIEREMHTQSAQVATLWDGHERRRTNRRDSDASGDD